MSMAAGFFLMILVTSLIYHAETTNPEAILFKNNTSSCYSTEYIGSFTKPQCAMKCGAQTDRLCIAFGYDGRNCAFCIVCPKSSALNTFISSGTPYSDVAFDFADNLQQDLLIHAPMDQIVPTSDPNYNGITPVTGATAKLHGGPGPYITTGKFDGAIYTPNSAGSTDDNVIKLGTNESDCLGNIFLCRHGVTFSLWFKASSPRYGGPNLFDSTTLAVNLQRRMAYFKYSVRVKKATHYEEYSGLVGGAYNTWNHLGITYSQNAGLEIFFDGCRQTPEAIAQSLAARTVMEFQLGCSDGSGCAEIHYDDLRVWKTRKSLRFMWWLSKM